ncbi:hypothetical protein P7C71_g4021, partial [Lecanoromycetidae sp. Uapishka_2]
MEQVSNDTSELGCSIFDRWGALKSDFVRGPKKGTGVWGQELDYGRILLIETLLVHENHRREGYGKKLFDLMWAQAQKRAFNCAYASMWATVINDRNEIFNDGPFPNSESEKIYEEKLNVLEAFWRALGFRRIGTSQYFCYARHNSHPSRLLASEQDYQRPAVL